MSTHPSLLIATSNQGKFKEIAEILKDLPYKLLSLKSLKIASHPAETGASYAENALIKAKYYYDLVKIPVIAEDSGLEVAALKGALGINTRRFGAGEKASDREWLAYFLQRMSKFPKKSQRKAKFVCVAVYFAQNRQKIFKGECFGTITQNIESKIKKGIPLSSCFKPFGCQKVYAALSPKEKNKVSHRGKAFGKLKTWLAEKSVHRFLA